MSNNPLFPPIASPNGQHTFPFRPQPHEKCARVAVLLSLRALCRYTLIEPISPSGAAVLTGVPLLLALASIPVVYRSALVFSGVYPQLSTVFLSSTFVFALIFVSILLLGLSLSLFIRLCSKRRFEIWISDAGLFKRYPNRDIFFPWHKFIWLIERGDDLWLASFIDGCFVPREAFTSREEAHEFAAIIRELKRTRGTVWRDKWNGRIFGVQP